MRIAELRKERGISQEQLADILDLSNGAVAAWEIGRTEPKKHNLIRLADYFEVSTDYLLGRTNDIGNIEVDSNLTPYQQELIYLTNQLTELQKGEVIGFAKSFFK